MLEKLKVGDYMTHDVITVKVDDSVEDVVKLIRSTGHDGFPVVRDGRLEGYVSSMDLLLQDPKAPISRVMSTNLIVAQPDTDLIDAARVIFRSGISKLPVINETGRLIGIITNSDVIRSQIERADPQKVWKLKKTLEVLHDVELIIKRDKVKVSELRPTQSKIYADELEGRIYELKKKLAEPIVVIQKPAKLLLVDGHHRAIAAKKLGIEYMDAYIIVLNKDIALGMEKTARDAGLKTLDDIKILDYVKHPLIEATTRLMMK